MKTNTLRNFLESTGHRLRKTRSPVDVSSECASLCSQSRDPLLLENLIGYPGWRLADRLVGDRELQGLALDCKPEDVIEHYANCMAQEPGRLEEVKDGPAKEIIWRDDEISLHRIPVPVPSEGISVPHLGLEPKDFRAPVISGSIAITRHPDSGIHNCFFTMAKVVEERRVQCYIFSPHTWENINAWSRRGERAPMALVIGCHPACELAAAYTGPHSGFGELNIAASLLGTPVPMIRCDSVDLQVPVLAEVIIEGLIDPTVADYIHTSAHTDTHTPFISKEPFLDVTGITMREDPIYRHIQPTRFTDHHAICEFVIAPMLYKTLKSKGINVIDVSVPLHSGVNCAVIQLAATVDEEVKEALYVGMTNPFFPRLTVVVDEDIDIYDANDILYALSIRVNPTNGIHTLTGVRSFNLEPQSAEIPGLPGALLRSGGRYGINATKPPLSRPEARVHFERLRARGDGHVRIQDYE